MRDEDKTIAVGKIRKYVPIKKPAAEAAVAPTAQVAKPSDEPSLKQEEAKA